MKRAFCKQRFFFNKTLFFEKNKEYYYITYPENSITTADSKKIYKVYSEYNPELGMEENHHWLNFFEPPYHFPSSIFENIFLTEKEYRKLKLNKINENRI